MMEPSHTCSLINALNHTMMTSELRMVMIMDSLSHVTNS